MSTPGHANDHRNLAQLGRGCVMPVRTKKVARTKQWQSEAEGVRRAVMEQRDPADQPFDPILVPNLEPLKRLFELSEGEDPYGAAIESICGATDDSQPVEGYDGTLGVTTTFVADHQRAVAQVQWNNNLASIYTSPGNVSDVRWGSGTMISPNLFLTAGHLFDQTGNGWTRPRVNGTSNTISPQEIATNMHLNFNFQDDPMGNPRPVQSFAITALLEYRLGGVDFAVCQIAGNPGNTWGWTNIATADAAIGDMLAIIGHPLGVPKRIEAGPTTSFSGNSINYNDIDTLGGNSGSGILRAASGDIVGVHTNGGCNAMGTGVNSGMRISVIRANSPTIQNLNIVTNWIKDQVYTSFLDDVQPTLHRIDKHPWADKPIWDDIGTSLAADVFNPTKRFDDVKLGGYDDPRMIDPGMIYAGGGPMAGGPMAARPFILSTPHHAQVPAAYQAVAMGQPGVEAGLARLEAALTQIAAEVEALRAQSRGGGG